ncbi:hypothetical protein [Spirosoma spitsbergense]|uniref:hypothetical protein n=1 Tax=Spirosoma spitsbergense TaxID=431554 RepID=UPI00037F2C87|nr:hypothetical protein [Spirosoma spitsbergense]
MARYDIWQDGINTRFTSENQPANRGRKKGRPNRATLLRVMMKVIQDATQRIEQERRDHRNALRRERYRAKKRAGEMTE